MRWWILSRSLGCVFLVAMAAVLAVTWGAGDGVSASPAMQSCSFATAPMCLGSCLVGTCMPTHIGGGSCWCGGVQVGGTTELLVGGPDSPAGPVAASGSSGAPYAVLAGGLVVAGVAVALTAGGWYARSRFSRG